MFSTGLARVPMWEGHLAALVLERMHARFEWGRNDCVTFAADAVHGLIGVDPIATIRGTWRCELGAARAMREFCGWPDIVQATEFMAQRLAWPRVPAPLARRGDLVMVEGRLAVMTGGGAASPGPHGLVIRAPMVDALAWSV
jgi:hypothetical protein